jgi:hypothetical protein
MHILKDGFGQFYPENVDQRRGIWRREILDICIHQRFDFVQIMNVKMGFANYVAL